MGDRPGDDEGISMGRRPAAQRPVDVASASRWFKILCATMALSVALSACGGDDQDSASIGETADVDAGDVDDSATSDTVSIDSSVDDSSATDSSEPSAEDAATPETDSESSEQSGNGVILADLCAGGQPLNGAITMDDLVSYGLFTSTDVTIESNSAYQASTYETFGFICNISETVGDGENFLTIGVKSGSDIWDLAAEQGDAPSETIGEWDVIVGSNWLSPLTMRTTDAAGNQDSMFFTWTQSDGSIPDAETLEHVMRPLAEAIGSGATADIPRN